MDKQAMFSVSGIPTTSTLTLLDPDWSDLMPDLVTSLAHLPSSKPYSAQRFLLPRYECQVGGKTATIMETCYPQKANRICMDGEIVTAIGLYLHNHQDEKHPDRVYYLDANFASCLGNLTFYPTSNLTYVMRRLSETQHRLVVNHSWAGSFRTGKLITDVSIPFFEVDQKMCWAYTTAMNNQNFLGFDPAFHASLHHPGARRLYRFLARSGIEEIFVSDLAAVLGIYTGYPDTMDDEIVQAIIPEWGKLHRAIDRASAELVERGFIDEIHYDGEGEDRCAVFDLHQ